ncbi:tripartite tricarboxylate transporter substrate-binding protein [Variovorax paradoxus]|uniref:tripartite tricarboxylate transporter substrate-binding protein n=1 Tax=Variovorax paradoxus TaxID=34073 RepID=UPI00193349BA|nr:tripartite tricarboxylate transporter substrate binding protein [Variovorax paradoxus]
MADDLGQPVIIDNRPGAGGTIGTEFVARSPADGHTLLMVFDTHAVNPLIYPGLKYDTFKDFAAISLVGRVPLVFATYPKASFNDLQGFVKQAKKEPGKLSYASVGAGSSGHLLMEQFKMLSQIDVLHVPFKGGAPALSALMGEQTDLLVFAAGAAVPLIQHGKIKALALTGDHRTMTLPAIPTTAEGGFPQLNSSAWMGLVVPAATPVQIIDRLQLSVSRAVSDANVAASLKDQAVELEASTPKKFEAFIRSEHQRWSKIISDAKLDLRQ